MIEAGEIEPTGVDINAYYWDSAAKVWKLLDSFDSEEGNLPLSKAEIYAFLKLAAPIAINKSVIKIEGNEITDERGDHKLSDPVAQYSRGSQGSHHVT